MIVILGLVILVAAVVTGVAGVLANSGHAHAVGHFSMLGYHVTGSTGTLFLSGIVVGAVALLGLSLLLAGARRTSRRGRDARRSLAHSRRETAAVSQDRDDLLGERDNARTYTAGPLGNGGAARTGSNQRGRGIFERLISRRAASGQPARGQEPTAVPASEPAPADIPVGASAPAG
jgi:hypothetical protein